jgi:hypothetical protein
VFEIVVHKNVRLSEVIVSDILDSDHLPIIFHLLDLVKSRNLSEPVYNFTDWELFRSLAFELVSHNIQIYSSNEADKAAGDFAASISSAYRVSTRIATKLIGNTKYPD